MTSFIFGLIPYKGDQMIKGFDIGFHSDNEKSVLSYLLNIQKTNKNLSITRK